MSDHTESMIHYSVDELSTKKESEPVITEQPAPFVFPGQQPPPSNPFVFPGQQPQTPMPFVFPGQQPQTPAPFVFPGQQQQQMPFITPWQQPNTQPVPQMSQAEIFEQRIRNYVSRVKPRIAILTPCYGGTVFTSYTESIIISIKFLENLGIPVRIYFCKNDSLVSRARNNLVAKAMSNQDNTHFLFIDSDITWSPIDILKLLIADRDLIGGIYPVKHYHWERLLGDDTSRPDNNDKIQQWLMRKRNSPHLQHLTDSEMIQRCLLRYNLNFLSSEIRVENNVAEVRHVATGFMMFRRSVIEKMIQSFPGLKYVDDVGFLSGSENDYAYALFDCGVESGHYFSEDWMFCERWRNMGGAIHVDVTIELEHTGMEVYSGCFLSTTGGA